MIEHGLLRRRRPRPALGHGLASGDVRFRLSIGPTSAVSITAACDHLLIAMLCVDVPSASVKRRQVHEILAFALRY